MLAYNHGRLNGPSTTLAPPGLFFGKIYSRGGLFPAAPREILWGNAALQQNPAALHKKLHQQYQAVPNELRTAAIRYGAMQQAYYQPLLEAMESQDLEGV